MNEMIRLFVEKGLLFPVQAIIIAADIYLITKSTVNYFIMLSLILVLSTVVLQTVRRRFLLLYPANLPMGGRGSAHVDTYYLRIVLILSMLFLVLGVCFAYQERFIEFNSSVGKFIPYSIAVLLLFAPLLFWIFSTMLNRAIANKLKKGGPSPSISRCPICSSRSALHECNVIDKTSINVKTQCLKCGRSTAYELSANIGE